MTDMADSIRADRGALVTMLVESVRLADWAAGEGIVGPDGCHGPEEFLCAYVESVGVCPDDGSYAAHAERKLIALLSENAALRERVKAADDVADALSKYKDAEHEAAEFGDDGNMDAAEAMYAVAFEMWDLTESSLTAYRATQKDDGDG